MPDRKKRKRADRKLEQRQSLKADFPLIYADLQAGRIASLKESLHMAGLKEPKPRLRQLQKIWHKATPEEQQAFGRWLLASGNLPAPPGAIATGRYLLPETILRLEDIMKTRRLTPGAVMVEMGFDAGDPALGLAMARHSSLRLVVIAALTRWLSAQVDP